MAEMSQNAEIQLETVFGGTKFGGVIIGFDYDCSKGKCVPEKLPGTCVDIFRARNFFRNTSKVNDLVILTDIKTSPSVTKLIDPIIDGIVDDKIVDFFPTLLESKDYNYVFCIDDLITSLKNTLLSFAAQHGGLVVYYTGHAEDSKIVLPSGELYDIVFLEDIIRGYLPEIELLIILDCCSTVLQCGINPKSIYLVSSVTNSDRSMSTSKGSLFSRVLFSMLLLKTDDLKKIENDFPQESEKDRRCRIKMKTYATRTKIWEWVFGERFRVIDTKGFLILTTM